MADHLRTVIDTLSPEDQAEVAGLMAAGEMLRNILSPDIPPGPPYVHVLTGTDEVADA